MQLLSNILQYKNHGATLKTKYMQLYKNHMELSVFEIKTSQYNNTTWGYNKNHNTQLYQHLFANDFKWLLYADFTLLYIRLN